VASTEIVIGAGGVAEALQTPSSAHTTDIRRKNLPLPILLTESGFRMLALYQLILAWNWMLRGPPTPKCESKLPSSADAVISVLFAGPGAGSAKLG
jgi:hypothetical protein